MLPLSIVKGSPSKTIYLVLTIGLITLVGCQRNKGTAPQTKEDSLKIAEAYYDNHPGESKAVVAWSNDSTPTQYLTTEEVMEYLDRYHKNPALVNNVDTPLKGFVFAGSNFDSFKSDARLKGIYVAFATKPNGDFTVMFRGLDEKGFLILNTTDSAQQISAGEPVIAMALQGPPTCPPNTNCPTPPSGN